jgi:ribosomal protein L29
MATTTSPEELMQQLESLKRELEDCRKAKELCQYNELKYRSLVEYANEGFIQ